ncbi:DegT/DnrJ/EryC1/StrS family aminotransferase [Citricoccus sp. NPDC055426]|uniref:DegT/DnrJ/EryC1/StrS family aminotransferase n=1 Tax=Citricoccus sp. NPDC055426 TaxID=3155536 RepID=UPI00341D86D7
MDLGAQQHEIGEEVRAGLCRVFDAASFIGGPDVQAFEREFASFTDVSHCVGTNNGTDALELALRASGVTVGGQVILPANSPMATFEAVLRIGALPLPVDVDSRYLLIDPEAAAAAVTGRTQALLPVHLYGQTAFVERIRPLAERVGAVIVEDASQSQGSFRHGRMAGSLGLAAGTSFSPHRNLGAAGDAGAVMSNDAGLAARVRVLGDSGSHQTCRNGETDKGARMDTVQAVVLRASLARLERWNGLRRAAADRYAELLRPMAVSGMVWLPSEAPGNYHVWHLYTVQVENRDRVLTDLHEAGIGAGAPHLVRRTEAHEALGPGCGFFPVAEAATDRLLSLPIFPHITAEQQERVVKVLARSLMIIGR